MNYHKIPLFQRGGRGGGFRNLSPYSYTGAQLVPQVDPVKQVRMYHGAPIQELQQTGAKLEKDYYQNLDTADKVEFTLNQLELLEGDEGIRSDALTGVKNILKDTAERGDWENANLAVRKAAQLVSGNPEIRAAMKNYESYKADEEMVRQIRGRGERELQYGDKGDFTTRDPETGQIRYYKSRVEQRADWEGQQEQLFNDMQANMSQDKQFYDATHGYLGTDNVKHIAADRIKDYVLGEGIYAGNSALNRYLGTHEGQQELEALTKIGDGGEPLTKEEAINKISQELISTGFEKVFNQTDTKFVTDWQAKQDREFRKNHALKTMGYNNAYARSVLSHVDGKNNAPQTALTAFFPNKKVDLSRGVLTFGENTPLANLSIDKRSKAPLAAQFYALDYSNRSEIKKIIDHYVFYGASPGTVDNLNIQKDIIARELDNRGLEDTPENRKSVRDELYAIGQEMRTSGVTDGQMKALGKFSMGLDHIGVADAKSLMQTDNIRHEDGRIFAGVIGEVPTAQLENFVDPAILKELEPILGDNIIEVVGGTDKKEAKYQIRSFVEHQPSVDQGINFNDVVGGTGYIPGAENIVGSSIGGMTVYNKALRTINANKDVLSTIKIPQLGNNDVNKVITAAKEDIQDYKRGLSQDKAAYRNALGVLALIADSIGTHNTTTQTTQSVQSTAHDRRGGTSNSDEWDEHYGVKAQRAARRRKEERERENKNVPTSRRVDNVNP